MDNKLMFLFRKVPLDILMELIKEDESYGHDISFKVGCTYAHATKIIKKLEERGIIESKKVGRKKILKITKKGKEICEHLNQVVKKL